MGRVKETLWVEPRLRGFVVTPHHQNPHDTVGRFIHYDLAWGCLERGGGYVPREDGVGPLRAVRLRVSSDGMRKLARRAMERDLASRIRDGGFHGTVKTPTWKRWLPWGMLALAAFNIVMGVLGRPGLAPGLVCGAAFGLGAVVFAGFARINVSSVGVDEGDLVIDRLDGRSDRRPLETIEYMTPGMGGALVRFADGAALRFDVSTFPARTLFRTLRRVYAPHAEAQDTRNAHRALKRSAIIYWPIGCVIIGIAHWYLSASNGWQIPGYPALSAALSSLTVCFGLGAVFALQAFGTPALVAWSEKRDWRRERARMRAAGAAVCSPPSGRTPKSALEEAPA